MTVVNIWFLWGVGAETSYGFPFLSACAERQNGHPQISVIFMFSMYFWVLWGVQKFSGGPFYYSVGLGRGPARALGLGSLGGLPHGMVVADPRARAARENGPRYIFSINAGPSTAPRDHFVVIWRLRMRIKNRTHMGARGGVRWRGPRDIRKHM